MAPFVFNRIRCRIFIATSLSLNYGPLFFLKELILSCNWFNIFGTVLFELEMLSAIFICVTPVLPIFTIANFISSIMFFRPERVAIADTVVEHT